MITVKLNPDFQLLFQTYNMPAPQTEMAGDKFLLHFTDEPELYNYVNRLTNWISTIELTPFYNVEFDLIKKVDFCRRVVDEIIGQTKPSKVQHHSRKLKFFRLN
jgi:hypothetical protein